jgi:protein phosphatase
MIYRALGNEPTIEVDTHSHALSLYDGLLLCSDGLTAYMDGEEAARQIFAAGSVHEAASTLIALANKRGGRDNISVALALLEQIEHVCL